MELREAFKPEDKRVTEAEKRMAVPAYREAVDAAFGGKRDVTGQERDELLTRGSEASMVLFGFDPRVMILTQAKGAEIRGRFEDENKFVDLVRKYKDGIEQEFGVPDGSERVIQLGREALEELTGDKDVIGFSF